MAKPNPMGATFAERAAAAAGKDSFKDPTPDPDEAQENTTFASRGGKGSKAVKSDDAEDKSVKSSTTKTAKKAE